MRGAAWSRAARGAGERIGPGLYETPRARGARPFARAEPRAAWCVVRVGPSRGPACTVGPPARRYCAAMATLIENPTVVEAAGSPTKVIREHVGRVNTGDAKVSVARMTSPAGWSEPWQRPEFDEWTVVLGGALHVEDEDGSFVASAGQAVHAAAGRRVRYSTPDGAEYLAVCVPAFAVETVHRDAE